MIHHPSKATPRAHDSTAAAAPSDLTRAQQQPGATSQNAAAAKPPNQHVRRQPRHGAPPLRKRSHRMAARAPGPACAGATRGAAASGRSGRVHLHPPASLGSVAPPRRKGFAGQTGQLSSAQLREEEGARWTSARQTGQREAARTQGTAQDQWKRCAQGRCATTSPARTSSRHTAHSHASASASDGGGVLHRPSRLQLNRRRRRSGVAPPPLAGGFVSENTSRCSAHGCGVAPAGSAAAVAGWWTLLLLLPPPPPLVLAPCGTGFAVVRGRTVPPVLI
jgi:hypothetical protein